MKALTKCKDCGRWINPEFGNDSYADHQEAAGTKADPRAPGEYDDVCTHCQVERLDEQAERRQS